MRKFWVNGCFDVALMGCFDERFDYAISQDAFVIIFKNKNIGFR